MLAGKPTQRKPDRFAQDGRGDHNANETSLLVSSLFGPTAPNALGIGRLRLSEPLERTVIFPSITLCDSSDPEALEGERV